MQPMYTVYMALHLTNPTVEHEVRALALERGQSITDVIGAAVRDFKRRNQNAPKPKPSVEEVLELIRSFPSGPVNDDRIEDEILGYGPNGYAAAAS
jgi:hypothetical protein